MGTCEHNTLSEPPTDMNRVVLEYFFRDEPAFRTLQKVVVGFLGEIAKILY